MSPKIRKILFYCLIGVFVLLGAYLLITAQGWILDLKNFKITKTGSLYLKYSPTDATIEINGKASNASPGILSSGVLISGLIPDDYHVKISESGYLSWEKTMTVGEAVVTPASQIKLWPEVWKFKEVATSSISDFWLTGAGAVLQFKDKSLHLNGNLLRGQRVDLSNQNSALLVSFDGQNYFLTDLENPKIPLNLSGLFNVLLRSQFSSTSTTVETPKQFFFHPFNGNKILITTESALYSLDWKRDSLERLAGVKGLTAAAASNSEIFLEDSKGNLIVSNIFLQTSSAYETEFPTSTTMGASQNGSFAFSLKNGDLDVYDRSSRASSTVFENIKNFFVSSDEKKLILVSKDNKLTLIVLNDYYFDGSVKKGDQWSISSDNAEVTDFKWLSDNSNYGLLLNNDKLSVTELDKKTPENIYLITNGVKKFFTQGNSLYVLKSDGTLLETSLK